MASNLTKLENMVNPQVLADMLSGDLKFKLKFKDLLTIDDTLQGRAGNTITVPKFCFIGEAQTLAEGESIDASKMQTATEQITIKKSAKAVEISDEALLSGYGNIEDEIFRQLLLAISSKIDNDCIEALLTTSLTVDSSTKTINYDSIVDAVDKFEEEEFNEAKYLFIHPKQVTQLRKSPEFIDKSKYGGDTMFSGAVGMIAGCQVVPSKRVKDTGDNYEAILCKEGALKLYLKKNVEVEADRDILNFTNVYSASEHYTVHLYDQSKSVKITFKKTDAE